MDGAAPYLPEEIITNILKRLLVKSLMRFRCVCKHWKNLFKTPSFIADHLCYSRRHNPSFLFFQSYGINSLRLRLVDCEMQVRAFQKAPPFDSLQPRFVSIIGSSNGLLCVAIRKIQIAIRGIKVERSHSSLLLWNPATRDVREVPRSRIIDSCEYNCVFGYGFSPFVNDYKIVAIYHADDGMVWGVEVYSLSRDSWKEIEFGNLQGVTVFDTTVASSNGAIFWYGYKSGEEVDRVIVSFDIGMEAFTLMPLLSGISSSSLTVYEDKPAILNYNGWEGSPDFDLWVMEEDIGSSGERWSWTKKLTGGPCPWALVGGTVWKNEIVMSGVEIGRKIGNNDEPPKCGLCLFNVTTNEFKMLVIPKYLPSFVLDYVESLVPVVNIHNIEEP